MIPFSSVAGSMPDLMREAANHKCYRKSGPQGLAQSIGWLYEVGPNNFDLAKGFIRHLRYEQYVQ